MNVAQGNSSDSGNYVTSIPMTGGAIAGNPLRTGYPSNATITIAASAGGSLISSGLEFAAPPPLPSLPTAPARTTCL